MTNKNDMDKSDLEDLDLGEDYSDDLCIYNTLSWKDYVLLYAIGVIILVFIIWANIATVDELARGMGKVIPSSKVQIVQNLEGGIIKKIHVKEGDTVQENQLLVEMNNVQANAEFQVNLKKYLSLEMSIIRLKAEMHWTELEFPQDIIKKNAKTVALEKSIYQANKQQFNSQLKIFQQRFNQKKEEIRAYKEQVSGTKKVLDISREEYTMIKPLADRGTVSRVELLQLDSKIASQETEWRNLKAALSRSKAALKEVEETVEEHKNSVRATVIQEISQKQIELETLKEASIAYKDRAERTDIKSPVLGKIKQINITTIGGVVQPGEAIMEIVPLNDLLIIEAMMSPADIAFIYPEQPAKIKITAYDYSIYGDLSATVKEISADTLETADGASFYRVKLHSDKTVLHYKGEDLPIIPGMVASVDILTGKKTVMDFLLKPFTKTLNNALHER